MTGRQLSYYIRQVNGVKLAEYCFHFCLSVCVFVRTQSSLQQCSRTISWRIYALSERLLVVICVVL